MKFIRLSSACVNQVPLDWQGNKSRIIQAIREAKNDRVKLLCLPELCISGYGCEDQFFSTSTVTYSLEVLQDIVSESQDIALSVGLPLNVKGSLFNASAMISNGSILGFYLKQNLARDGLHYEPRWFKAWNEGDVDACEINGQTYPVGHILFDLDGILIGHEICEDAWVANRPGRRYAAESVDIILNPSASHFAFDKDKVRENFVTDASRSFTCAYLYSNLVGNEAGRILYDGQCLIASNGRIIQRGKRFTFSDHQITSADVDIELNRLAKRRAGQISSVSQAALTKVSGSFSWGAGNSSLKELQPMESSWSKEVEWAKAISLGLFDYMRKTFSKGFVLSLSGGADSTATAIMVWMMRSLLIDELGESEALKKVSYWKDDQFPSMNELLFCVYQRTVNSGHQTENAARTIAEAIDADFDVWNVDVLVQTCRSFVEQSLGRNLSWERDDLALQNIQARVRSPGPWMMANCRSALFLTTSNRSEASVGYATMDGDTSGGLAPLGGTDKAFLLQWLSWMETQDGSEIPALPAVKVVNELEPTAELRPEEMTQKDEDDLMPYSVLDQIERWAIRDKRNPLDIFEHACQFFSQYPHDRLGQWVIKFFQLWSRNQWKRERLAPNFHVDDENVDPKTWCRFPILNGGFALELKQLRDKIKNMAS